MTIPNQNLMRVCKKCDKEKPLSEFMPNPNNGGKTYQYKCRDCDNLYHIEWRKKQEERYRTMQRKRHHERMNVMNPEELALWRKNKVVKKSAKYYQDKHDVYMAYGGYKCACCGEKIHDFLTIDHTENNGRNHRREIGTSSNSLVYWLKKNNYPEGFQILCWNCQWGKLKNGGTCPHQAVRNDHPVTGVGSSDSKQSVPKVGNDMICSTWKHVAVSKEAGLN